MPETTVSSEGMRRRCFVRIGAMALPVLAARIAFAADSRLPSPTPPIVLTVSGSIAASNSGVTATFGASDLEAIDNTEIATTTPWFDGVQRFSGPKLSAVLRRVGATGTTIETTALNDYVVNIPFADADAYQPILALRRNGKFMSVREKGPIFIIYPFDSNPSLKTELFFSRCTWQLNRIAIRN